MDANQIFDYASKIPKWLTEQIVNFINSNGFHVTERWVSVLLFAVSMALIWLIVAVAGKMNKFLKWIIIIIVVVLLVGLFIPW